MDFSELFKQTQQLCAIAPNGNYIVSKYTPITVQLSTFLQVVSVSSTTTTGQCCTIPAAHSRLQDATNNEFVHQP